MQQYPHKNTHTQTHTYTIPTQTKYHVLADTIVPLIIITSGRISGRIRQHNHNNFAVTRTNASQTHFHTHSLECCWVRELETLPPNYTAAGRSFKITFPQHQHGCGLRKLGFADGRLCVFSHVLICLLHTVATVRARVCNGFLGIKIPSLYSPCNSEIRVLDLSSTWCN